MRWLRRGLLVLLALLLALGGAVAWLAGSESGLRQGLALAQRHAPGELAWQRVAGRLTGPLAVDGLRYRQPDGLAVELGEVRFDWRPADLLQRRLRIERLHLTGLTLRLPPPTESPAPPPRRPLRLPQIRLPLAIELHDIDVRDLRIYPHGASRPIVVEQARLEAVGQGEALQVVDLRVQAPQGQVLLSGTVQPVGDYPISLAASWTYRDTRLGELRGKGTAQGDLRRLALVHEVQGPLTARLEGDLRDLLDTPGWDVKLTADSDDLGVFSPELAGAPLRLRLTGQGRVDDFTAAGRLATRHPVSGPLRLDLDLAGNPRHLDLKSAVLQLEGRPGRLAVHGGVDLQPLRLALDGDWQDLAWPLTGAPPQVATPRGRFHFAGTPQDFTARLDGRLTGDQTGPLDLTLRARGEQSVFAIERLTLRSPDGQRHLQATGRVDVPARRFTARGDWQGLAWPLSGPPQVQSARGRFSGEGRFDDYRFRLDADLAGAQIPPGQWRLAGQGNDRELTALTVDGAVLGGHLQASGTAGWRPRPRWDLTLTGQGLDPGRQWPELPGRLDLRLTSSGRLGPDGPEASAEIARLAGRFRGQPVTGHGRLRLAGGTLTVRGLELASGPAHLRADGVLGERLDLRWDLAVPELARLLPAAAGRLQAEGRLAGSRTRPELDLTLQAARLAVAGQRIDALEGRARLDASGRRASTLHLAGKGLSLGGQTWRTLTLDGSGTPARHHLAARLDGPLARLALALRGGLRGQRWQGELGELTARKTELGDWTLAGPAPLRYDLARRRAEADGLCLVSQPTRLCLQGHWQAGQGAAGELSLTGLRPERFRAWLPDTLRADTALSLQASGGLDAAGTPHGRLHAELAAGTWTLKTADQPLRLAAGTSVLDAELRGSHVQASARLDLGPDIRAQTALKLDGPWSAPRVDGKLQARIADLGFLAALTPQLQAVTGRLDADLDFVGPLRAPGLRGQVALRDFGAEVPAVDLRLERTRFTARADGQGPLTLDGEAHAGPGRLALSGRLDPATRRLTARLQGEDFPVADSARMRVRISPDLTLAMDSQGMAVEGELRVPQAFIDAKGGGGDIATVSPSPDVVLVDADGQRQAARRPLRLDLKVRVVLGDDVRVKVADFQGALKGSLLVEQSPGEAMPRGTGTIEVVNGDYVVYGQQLKVQRGRVLFGGGPVDNPRLDIDVARRVEAYDVLAGARIRGTAQAPLLQLYSEPPMPDASILSYMLLGQPPGTKGASFTLGKYLTPRLYVSYGIGLLNAINTFNLRYKLTDKLAVEAASGLASSADLIYTIER